MVLIVLVLLLLLQCKTTTVSARISLPGCTDNCGGVPIPYPFGIGTDCFMEGFEVLCSSPENGESAPMPYVTGHSNIGNMTLLDVILSSGQARVGMPISSRCYNETMKADNEVFWFVNGSGTPFKLNHMKNKFTVVGCNNLAYLLLANDEYEYLSGCVSACGSLRSLTDSGGSCAGVGCCQTAVPKGINFLQFWFDKRFNSSAVKDFNPCGYATVLEDAAFSFKTSYITTDELVGQEMPAVIDWSVGTAPCEVALMNRSSYACRSSSSVCLNSIHGSGYLCNCSDGYQGNPYLDGGCQDINECANQNPCSKPGKCHNLQGGYRCSCPFGWQRKRTSTSTECELNLTLILGTSGAVVALLVLGFGTYMVQEKRNLSKLKERYFQEHGGWILLEDIKSKQGFGFVIFSRQQIEQATNNFDDANIIGHGGQGTVYKGVLRDRIVAIKKCKIVDENKKKEFGKEMLILSQINHKNIVKLLGCCLEVEIPMLVYEYLPNSTLYNYIHYKNSGSRHIPLVTRLRIACESAEALAYLHTSASPPIFHGDVKSANILLDRNFTAKVSDFGASMLAPRDKLEFVTLVQGTWGYLDPEYMQSCQLTDKSDVYSFGVVLLELLTRKPIIDFDTTEEERSLSSRFLSAMKVNKMHELLDDEIKNDADMELIGEVAELAKACLSMKGEERPMMVEVVEELHRISKIKQHLWGQQQDPDETKVLLSERFHGDIEIEHSGYHLSLDKEAVESITFGR